jgi:uncharacterized membrane protein (DUF4010 family)
VLVACAVLNPSLAALLPRYTGAAFIIGAVAVAAAWRANASDDAAGGISESPLNLRAALQMTALFQIVLFLILVVQARWGSQAVVATSALVGLTDLDALTLSLARSTPAGDVRSTAAVALVAGILSNTLLKLTVALVIGRGWFRTATAAGLGAMALALAVALLIAR